MPSSIVKPPFDAYKGSDPYIFISYAHKDAEVVFPELVHLKSLGFNVWYDEGIDPGNEWPDEIAQALNGCYYFLFYVSPRSVASVNCRNEVYFALDQKKPFLSIYIEETNLAQINKGLALSIGSLQAIMRYRMDKESFSQKLTKALSKVPYDSTDAPAPSPEDAIEVHTVTTPAPTGSGLVVASPVELHPRAKSSALPLILAFLALILLLGAACAVWYFKTTLVAETPLSPSPAPTRSPALEPTTPPITTSPTSAPVVDNPESEAPDLPSVKDEQPFALPHADYGVRGELTRNVTNLIRAKIVNGHLDLTVGPQAIGVDPAPGKVKTLHLVYTINGVVHLLRVLDGLQVHIPFGPEEQDSKGADLRHGDGPFQIISAGWDGYNVTKTLQAKVSNNHFDMIANWVNVGCLGFKDNHPGFVKTLTIRYSVGNEIHEAHFWGGSHVRLP